jgi:ATP-dependent DNA helicase RecQ
VSEFDAYRNATSTGLLILTAMRVDRTEPAIMNDVYRWLAEGRIKTTHAPTKCLVIESSTRELPDDLLNQILDDVEEKKAYRTELFYEFVGLLENYTTSSNFHRAIGDYLGIDKFSMDRQYQTLSGDMVRSKSEVIIANILYESGIPFEYEAPLQAADGSKRWPDFTIKWQGQEFYWEHWGMLDDEDYARNAARKREWYQIHFPDQLISTKESSTLSRQTKEIITSRFGVEPPDIDFD